MNVVTESNQPEEVLDVPEIVDTMPTAPAIVVPERVLSMNPHVPVPLAFAQVAPPRNSMVELAERNPAGIVNVVDVAEPLTIAIAVEDAYVI